MRYFARKTVCTLGHKHDSKREADRCAELHLLFRSGAIDALVYEPQYWFEINGAVATHTNGRRIGYKPDFGYLENGKVVVEDVKAKNLHTSEASTLRMALFRHLFPSIELRVVK